MTMRTGDIFTFNDERCEFVGVDPADGFIIMKDLKTQKEILRTSRWFELWGHKIKDIQPTTPLLEFLKDEVPYRLNEYLGYDETEVPQEIIDRIIKWVYDRYNSLMAKVLQK